MKSSRRSSSKRWNLSDPHLPENLHHQAQPFLHSLFNSQNSLNDREFKGTIFRFPLRKEAEHSDISKSVYSEQKVRSLFEMFEKEAHHLLLFLNDINKIEVYEKESAKTKPKLLMSVSVATPEALHTRVQFKKSVAPFARDRQWMPSPLSETYKMSTRFTKQERPPKVKVSNKQWLVTQYYDGGDSPAKKFLNEKGSKYLPWMGVALQLAEGARCCAKKSGQIFCFLPLPKQEESLTSFNFHVNGFFSVSQDRCVCVTLEDFRSFFK